MNYFIHVKFLKTFFVCFFLLLTNCNIFDLPKVGNLPDILAAIGTVSNSGNSSTAGGTVSPNTFTVSFGNARNNSMIETGFLVGTTTATNGTVQVQIDSGNWENATGLPNWNYKLPSGSNTWRFHATHTVCVRSMNASSV